MMKPKPSAKYREARAVLRVLGAFHTDYRAEAVYRALERRGWAWDGKRWVSPTAK